MSKKRGGVLSDNLAKTFDKNSKRQNTPLSSYILFTIGMSFYWYWSFFRRWEFSTFFLNYPDPAYSSHLGYAFVMASMVFITTICILKSSYIEMIIREKPFLVCAFSLSGTIGYSLLFFIAPLKEFQLALMGLGTILLALSFTSLTLAWATTTVSFRTRTALVCVALSFVTGSIMSVATFLPVPFVRFITAALPAFSGLCWVFIKTPPFSPLPYSKRETFDMLPKRFVAILAAFIIIARLLIGVLLPENELISFIERLESIILSSIALLIVAVILFRSHQWEFFIRKLWVVLSITFFAGVLITLFFNSAYSSFGIGVITSERNIFEVILWIILLAVISQMRLSVVFIMSLNLLFLMTIPSYLGRAVVPSLLNAIGWSTQDHTLALVLAMTLTLISIVLISQNTNAFQNSLKKTEDRETSRASACLVVSEEKGLSPRESEILPFLSRGYSTKKIADILFISQGTVLSHTKGIYRKIDVHTKQEVIDYIDTKMN